MRSGVEKKKILGFLLFSLTLAVLAFFKILSFGIELKGVTFELLYIPMVLSVILVFMVGFEKLLDRIKN